MIAAALAAVALALAAQAVSATPARAAALPGIDATCNQASPLMAPCIVLDKVAEGASAECRLLRLPPASCVLPIGHQVMARAIAAYRSSWTHSAVAFQYRLGGSLPLVQAQWLGTHNSFNSPSDGITLSHEDSNQQLTLTQQLNIDIRALELDTHWLPALNRAGGRVVVCHGQGAAEANFGCTTEPPLSKVLREIDRWLIRHPSQVILLYLDNNFGPAAAYSATVRELEAGLRRPNGASLIFHPQPSQIGARGCAELPLDSSRNAIRAAGAQVMIVGGCESGWSADVFGWDRNHVESGNTAAYQAFPACDATYSRAVYDSELVRYYEDSTLVSAVTGSPTETPAQYEANSLTPAKVAAMTGCGVNLFGFDQILPDDGRLAASVWSWAPGQPAAAAGSCTTHGTDGRWRTQTCTSVMPAACSAPSGWRLSPPTDFTGAPSACVAAGGRFDLPRDGYSNSLLSAAAGPQPVWINLRP